MGALAVKGYYKNWYQHYLEIEKEKTEDLQRGYYSNLAEKGETLSKKEKTINGHHQEENHNEVMPVPERSGRHKKKFRVFSFLLPLMTILGFAFLWYQMDVGPIRSFTHDVLVLAGIREDVADVTHYHTSLLDQHTAFNGLLATYITVENEIDFETLQVAYNEIHDLHSEVIAVSGSQHEAVMSLWSFKLDRTSQMMKDLREDGAAAAYEQFISDQEETEAMIRIALGIGTEI